jgi:1-acyl-sn-glycerol-3-phosphate acyltransferase
MAKEKLTRAEVRERYLALEKQGIFDQHVDPIDYDIVIPVTKAYHYYPVGLKEKVVHDFRYAFGVKPFMRKVNKVFLETSVVGRENLKGITKAIVTSNHVQMFDCIALKEAVKGHYLNIVAAPFNNFRGTLGDAMRASGMLPLPQSYDGMKHFEEALALSLKRNHYVLFFPEQAEWWYYRKPRPYKDGAFHYALQFNVPIIPCFITFAPRHKPMDDPEGMYPERMIVHILKPIYPEKGEDFRSMRDRLRDLAFAESKACYEEVYGIPLSYKE